MPTHVFGPNFQEKMFSFNFLIQSLFIYTKKQNQLSFQGIVLHTDFIIAF